MSEGTNRNLPGRNTLVQHLAMYTDPESHSAQCYRQTGRRGNNTMMPIADQTVYSIRSAKNYKLTAFWGLLLVGVTVVMKILRHKEC